MTDFESFDLPATLLKGLEKAGLKTPTPIQAQSIPALLEGSDVMASAATGTGKTAAFMVPALARMMTPTPEFGIGPRVIVLTPTRELAQQVQFAAKQFSSCMKRMNVVSVVGGAPFGPQLRDLSRPVEVLIATPGRLIDHMERGKLALNRVEMLVLDEADRMLDMGFIDDVRKIANALPPHQTALFSATLEGVVGELAKELTYQPKEITITTALQKAPNIEQRMHWVDDIVHKQKLLSHLLEAESMDQAIIFTATKRDADALADILNDNGHRAAALHGDMRQHQRTRTLQKMRTGGIDVLVATDVAARGIDVSSITHVINYDLPMFAEDYVHRIGRTGRAGAAGTAISFVSQRDRRSWFQIQKFTGQKVEPTIIAGLEPKTRAESGPKSRPSRGNAPRRQGEGSWSGEGRRRSGEGSSWAGAAEGRRRQNEGGWSGATEGRRRPAESSWGSDTRRSQEGQRATEPRRTQNSHELSYESAPVFGQNEGRRSHSGRPYGRSEQANSGSGYGMRQEKPNADARGGKGGQGKAAAPRQNRGAAGHKGQSQRHS